MTHETPNPTQATAKIAANTANNRDIPSKITTKRFGPTHNGFKEERKAPAIQKIKGMSRTTGKQMLLNILHRYIMSIHLHLTNMNG